jgi:hypothetical protein
MKNKISKKILLWSFLLTTLGAFAQSPSLINYQGTARLADGTPLDNRTISIKFEILQGSASGTPVATESKTLQTNALGLFSTLIGESANLSTINWQGNGLFLRVGLDTSAGTSFVNVGVQQLVSVPYAIHASSVPSSYTNNILSIGNSTYALSPTVAVVPNTSITVSGLGTVTSVGTNSFDINIPSPSFTGVDGTSVNGAYPNYTISSATPSIALTSTAAAGTSVTSSGSSFSLNVPPPTFTNAGPATITGAYPNFTINSSAGTTYTNGTGIGLTSGSVIVNTSPNITPTVAVTTTAAAGASVASTGSSFSLNVPPPTFTNAGPATITGAYPNFTINSTAAPTYTSGTGISITAGSINNTAPDQIVTFTNTGQTLITGTYPTFSISTPTVANTSIALTSTSAAGPSLTTSGTNSFNINIPPTNAWSLLGNAGTSTVTNFVGTTDNVALNFRVNNLQSGIIDPVLFNSSFGYQSGSSTTTANGGAGFGYRTLFANTTGNNNSAFGYRALSANTIGGANAAFGSDALLSNTAGAFNVAVGLNAGRGNTTGNNNTALGRDALYNNSLGSGNIAIGYQAGFFETGSNKLYISNSSTSVTPLIYGDFSTGRVGIGNASPSDIFEIGNYNSLQNNYLSIKTAGSNTYKAGVKLTHFNTTDGFTIESNEAVNRLDFIRHAGTSFTVMSIDRLSDNVGIGTTAPTATLHVAGTTRLVDGSQGLGKVLTSDASGNATWQTPVNSGWGLTGNAGTSSGSNFIGTTDGQELNFRTNNTLAASISTLGYFGIGSVPGFATTRLSIYGSESGTSLNAFSASPSTAIRIHNNDLTNNNFSSLIFSSQVSNSANFEVAKIVAQAIDHTSGSISGDLVFLTRRPANILEAMRIKGDGLVGINTSAPTATLHVNGTMRLVDGSQGAGKVLTSDGSGNATWQTNPGWGTSGNAGTTAGTNFIGTTDAQDLVFKVNNLETFRTQAGGGALRFPNTSNPIISVQAQSPGVGGNNLTIKAGNSGIGVTASLGGNLILEGGDQYNGTFAPYTAGNVIIRTGKNAINGSVPDGGAIIFQTVDAANTYTEAGRFDINGNFVVTGTATKPGGGSWVVASDSRLKKDVRPYVEGLKELMSIKPVWYTYTGEANLPTKTYVGVIAQELQSVAPYMVGEWNFKDSPNSAGTNYLSVDNSAMTYMLINSVKEQQEQIEQQQKQIDELKKLIDELLKK